jgi:hypothetical protein
MNNEDIPTYHKLLHRDEEPVLTPTECDALKTNSNSINPDTGMCKDGYEYKINGDTLIMCCSNVGETVKTVTLNNNNTNNKYALCCSDGKSTKGTVEGGVTYLGCCPLDHALYTYTDTASDTRESMCCPNSTPEKEYSASNGVCVFSCIDGQKNADGNCDTLTECLPAYKLLYPSGDSDPPVAYLSKGGYNVYENLDQAPIVEGNESACSNSDTLDNMAIETLSDYGGRCEYDSCQDNFLCCEDSDATIHIKTEPSTQSDDGGTTVNVYVYGSSGAQPSSPPDQCSPPPEFVCKKECPDRMILDSNDIPSGDEYNVNEFSIGFTNVGGSPVEYNSVSGGYECPSPDLDYECPEGYDRIDEHNQLKCRPQGSKYCYSNIDNRYDINNSNADWYVVRSNVATSYSCEEYFERIHGQSNWFDALDPCPRELDEYKLDNVDYIACCKSNDTDSNIYYQFVGGGANAYKCMNISDDSCGQFAHVNPGNTPYTHHECQCVESWSNISDPATYPDVTVFEKYRPDYNTPDNNGCIDPDPSVSNLDTECIDENSNMYCCPGLGKKPYKIAEGIYTCSNVWTSNIKPQGLNGYDAGAVVYHHIDFDLAKELEEPSTS